MNIETRSLEKKFENETVLSYRDMTFEDGKSYVLLGASGCGKSTLLHMIAGVLSPTSGEIRIGGRDMTHMKMCDRDRFRIEKIGYIFQDFKLMEDMSVEDNINVLRLERIDTSGMNDILEKLGISALKKRRVSRLSGGEKQRVAIARALIKTPDIILADEPTGNLNYAIGSNVVDSLLEAARGKTLVCVTHDDRLADRFDCVVSMDEVVTGREGTDNA